MVLAMPGNTELGGWIAQRRNALGLSQAKVSVETARLNARVSQSYLSQIESGDRPLDTLSDDRAEALRQVLQVDPGEWQERTGRAQRVARVVQLAGEEHDALRHILQDNNRLLHRLLSTVHRLAAAPDGIEPPYRESPTIWGYEEDEEMASFDMEVVATVAGEESKTLTWPIPTIAHRIRAFSPDLDTLLATLPPSTYVTLNPAPPERIGQVVLVESRGRRFLAYALDLTPSRVRITKHLPEFAGDTTLAVDHYFGRVRGATFVDPREYDAPAWVVSDAAG